MQTQETLLKLDNMKQLGIGDDVRITDATVRASEGDMEELRHRHFNYWSALGISYSLVGTPLTIGSYLAFNIGLGGSPAYIYGYMLASVMQLVICVSLAELAAAYPHSSGQVYWTTVFAPKRISRVASYWTGAFTASAWCFWSCGTFLFLAQLIFATVTIATSTFSPQSYQTYLSYVAAAACAILFNTVFFKHYSRLLRLMVIVVNAGTMIIMISLLVRAHLKRSATTVFVTFENDSGWTSDGFVFLLGLLPGITANNGFDSSTHVTDELENPSKQVPRVMVGTTILASLIGLPMTIVYMLCVTNEDNLLTPVGGQPIAQLFLDSCDSIPLTIVLMVIYLIVFLVGGCAMLTTMSRVIWSLAEQRQLILSSWLSKLGTENWVPVYAIYFSSFACCLLGLLCLGPATALNAILGTAAICFFISYMIPLACLSVNRSALTTRPHYMNLGRFGIVLNAIALCWMLTMSVILLFPLYLPVTASTMNYSIAVLGGVVLLYSLNWVFYARERYSELSLRS